MTMTVILLDRDFKLVPLNKATKAKVLNNPKHPEPYFVVVTPEFKIPPGTIVVDGTNTAKQKDEPGAQEQMLDVKYQVYLALGLNKHSEMP